MINMKKIQDTQNKLGVYSFCTQIQSEFSFNENIKQVMFITRHDEKYYDRTKFQTIRNIILKTNVIAIAKQCIFTICLLVLLSNHTHAEDWTQLGFGGVQGLRYDEQFAVGAMGLMNIELKHRHPKAWINYYSRVGFLGAFEYHNIDGTLSGTLQLSLISFWASGLTHLN
jgi:hypothetical protein